MEMDNESYKKMDNISTKLLAHMFIIERFLLNPSNSSVEQNLSVITLHGYKQANKDII